jgi:hypothetical protein
VNADRREVGRLGLGFCTLSITSMHGKPRNGSEKSSVHGGVFNVVDDQHIA